MAILPIVITGDPVLHNPTEPVTETPAELAQLIADMYETMDVANGVGLAANQVGLAKRLFVYDCPDRDESGKVIRRRGAVINPVLETSEIPETMPDPEDDLEGCLSVPGENFPTGAPTGRRSPAPTRTAIPSRSRDTDSSPGCCSTRSATSTVSCTSTS